MQPDGRIPYSDHHMGNGGEKTTRRASRPETVGAWLRLWTPPRDVEVPPVPPARTLLLWGLGVLVLVGGAIAVIAPRIDDAKDRAAAREERADAARRAAQRRRATVEQRAQSASAADLRPEAGAPAAVRLDARAGLLTRAEHTISEDARARAREGELQGSPGAAVCDPYPKRAEGARPEQDLGVRRGVYDCIVAVREIKATERNPSGTLGYPFRAVVDFDRFRFSWCRTNPVPGELMVPDPRSLAELPRACRARQ